jgi:hypothetical protein
MNNSTDSTQPSLEVERKINQRIRTTFVSLALNDVLEQINIKKMESQGRLITLAEYILSAPTRHG